MVYYWEHFGLMDNPTYAQNAYSKLQIYTSHGIIPSIQLITTYETKANPLSTDIVEKIIAYYFLYWLNLKMPARVFFIEISKKYPLFLYLPGISSTFSYNMPTVSLFS